MGQNCVSMPNSAKSREFHIASHFFDSIEDGLGEFRDHSGILITVKGPDRDVFEFRGIVPRR